MNAEETLAALKASAERKVERAALSAFVDTIEATGGVEKLENEAA